MIKRLNSQILFQRLQMRASLFSVVRRKWLLFVVENYVLISKIIYRFHVLGNLLSQVRRVAACLFSLSPAPWYRDSQLRGKPVSVAASPGLSFPLSGLRSR